MYNKIRKYISVTATFVFIVAVLTLIISLIWFIFPFCASSEIVMIRWPIALIITILLLATGVLKIIPPSDKN